MFLNSFVKILQRTQGFISFLSIPFLAGKQLRGWEFCGEVELSRPSFLLEAGQWERGPAATNGLTDIGRCDLRGKWLNSSVTQR